MWGLKKSEGKDIHTLVKTLGASLELGTLEQRKIELPHHKIEIAMPSKNPVQRKYFPYLGRLIDCRHTSIHLIWSFLLSQRR